MNFGFINPQVGLFNETNVIADTAENIPTVGRFTYRDEMTPPEITLLHLAALARDHGFTISYFDFNLDSNLEDLKKLDFALIHLTTHQASECWQLANLLHQHNCHVLFFGPHATALPEDALTHGDTVFCGEAEILFADWLKTRSTGCFGPTTPMDLNDLPTPAYEVLTPSNHRLIPLLSSRGCNRGCTYCWQILTATNHYRTKSIDKVLSDIQVARQHHDNEHFLFMDDNIFIDRQHGKKLMKALVPLSIRWSCQTDPEVGQDPELLDLARDAGCMRMLIGFESLNQASMSEIAGWKAKRIDQFASTIEAVQSRGIGVVGSFILGFDGDTKETITQLEEFLLTHIMANVSISILAPPPGTPLYKKLEGENRLLTKDWNDFNQCSPVFTPHNLTLKELENGVKHLFTLVHSPEMRKRRVKYFLEKSRRARHN